MLVFQNMPGLTTWSPSGKHSFSPSAGWPSLVGGKIASFMFKVYNVFFFLYIDHFKSLY